MRFVICEVLEPGQLQQPSSTLQSGRPWQRKNVGWQHDVFQKARPGQKHVVLKHDADLSRRTVEIGTISLQTTFRRPVQSADQAQESRLPAP